MLSGIDYTIIGAYLVVSLVLGWWGARGAQGSVKGYFLGGANNVWWLAGLSMVATTFAADTPLAVSEIVCKNGISGNWIWWNMLMSGTLTTFFFARYWKRTGLTTDLALITIRYSGKPATALRVFRAIYLGLFMNALIIGWVNFAMRNILKIFFELSDLHAIQILAALMLFTAVYSAILGLKGIMYTDALQFIIAMGGCILMAIYVLGLEPVQGIQGIQKHLPANYLNFFPSTDLMGAGTLVSYVFLNWWATWYPGAEPGGGGYVAQRMLATQNEKHAVWATLFFQFAHYALRPWAWIVVGLAAYILYPHPQDYPVSFVLIMKNYLPDGLKGLLLVAFFSAYMSTLSTQLNWGTSYILNDALCVFFNFSEKTLLNIAKGFVLVLMGFALWVSLQLDSVKQAWEFLLQGGAGIGFVLMARWYWWRISAWSEIAATLAPPLLLAISYLYEPLACLHQPDYMPALIFSSLAITLIVTFLTPPTNNQTLIKFYQKVKPAGYWGKFTIDDHANRHLLTLFTVWAASIIGIYAALFAIGDLILANYLHACMDLLIATIAAAWIFYAFPKTIDE